MLIDVLDLIAPQVAILGNNYLSGSTPNITYLSASDANGLRDLVYMKGLGGFPWDWLTVGEDYIYQRMTEYKWSDPSTGKLMFGKGSPRFPRYIDYSPAQPAGSWSFLVDPAKSSYVIYDVGGTPIKRSGDGFVRNTLSGPHAGEAIKDAKTGETLLPAGEDWYGDYEWGGKVAGGPFGTLERVYHRKGYGRYGWASYASVNGTYPATPNASSQTPKITPMPVTAVLPVQRVF